MSNIEKNLKKILRGKKGCSPQQYLPSTKKVGSGDFGIVFKGNVNGKNKRYVAYKEVQLPGNKITLAKLQQFLKQNPARMEYTIAKKLKGFGVPDTYLYKICDKKHIIYMEYIDGMELKDWWMTKPSLEQVKSVIVQVIYNLYRIHKKYPKFRHHDLHMSNILIKKVPEKKIRVELSNKIYTIPNGGVEAVMIDFGFSLFPRIKNPLINSDKYKNIGISRTSHKLYDVHFFLNSLFGLTQNTQILKQNIVKLQKFVASMENRANRNKYKNILMKTQNTLRKTPPDTLEIQTFIQSLLPKEYLTDSDQFVKEYRLRGSKNASHTLFVPGFEKILSKPFLTGEKRVLPIPKPRTFARPQIVPKKKASTPINKEAAYAKAVAIMRKQREVRSPKPIPRRRR
jgi:serine/threonine protein kinase